MTPAVFLVRDEDGRLVPMKESPYELENVLQGLLASHPGLLQGDLQAAEGDPSYFLVRREMALRAGEEEQHRWSIDHLFLDQEGIPTIVEVKRSTDTRLRREVVGQMLDYAANAVVYWPIEDLRAHLRDQESLARLQAVIGDEVDLESWWQRVKVNLEAGRVRLIFVADEIPAELRRIVEFLNGQMRSAEILALEIKRYSGAGITNFVSRSIGQTARAETSKGRSGNSEPGFKASATRLLKQIGVTDEMPLDESAVGSPSGSQLKATLHPRVC